MSAALERSKGKPPTIETLSVEARRLYDALRPAGSQTARSRALQDVLIATGGWTFYLGRAYDIRSVRVGPGVYRAWLAEQMFT